MADIPHIATVALTAMAGIGYVWAAARQWLRLGDAAIPAQAGSWWWVAFALQTAALTISLFDPDNRTLAYGELAAWSAVAAIMFAGRFVDAPVRLLLALPLGAVVLLIAIAGGTAVGDPPSDGSGSWIIKIHVGFMIIHLSALVAAGAMATLYILAADRLKAADPRATRLPTLPEMERFIERSLIWGTALLIGGLATGGGAIRLSQNFQLVHPTSLLGMSEMIILITVLSMHHARRLSRRALAVGALAGLTISVIGTLSLMRFAHG